MSRAGVILVLVLLAALSSCESAESEPARPHAAVTTGPLAADSAAQRRGTLVALSEGQADCADCGDERDF
jgi:hypothetical protein